jgi:hypothetical protein
LKNKSNDPPLGRAIAFSQQHGKSENFERFDKRIRAILRSNLPSFSALKKIASLWKNLNFLLALNQTAAYKRLHSTRPSSIG